MHAGTVVDVCADGLDYFHFTLLALVRCYDDIDIIKFFGSARVTRRRTIAALTGTGKRFKSMGPA